MYGTKIAQRLTKTGLLLAALCIILSFPAAAASDVPAWAESAVSRWEQCGKLREDMRLEEEMTRGDFAVALDSVMNYTTEAENTYSDLPSGTSETDAILRLTAAGVLNGDGAGHVFPDQTVTREEAAVMLARAFQLSAEGEAAYTDVGEVSSWAVDAVAALQENGVMAGSNGYFYPDRTLTYVETVQAITNALRGHGWMTGLTVHTRADEEILADGQADQVNDGKFEITSVEKQENGYLIRLQGLEPLVGEEADANATGEPETAGKWMGLCLTFHGLVSTDNLQYSQDGKTWIALEANEAVAEELRLNSVMMYVNGADTLDADGLEAKKESHIEIRQSDGSGGVRLTIQYTPEADN